MRFIDGFVVKYLKKEKKNYLSNVVSKLSEFLDNGIKCDVKPNENFGRIRLELYETEDEGELIFFNGLAFSDDLVEWLNMSSDFRKFSNEISLKDSLLVDVEISEVQNENIKGLIYSDSTVYVLLNQETTMNLSNSEIAKLVVKAIVEEVFESTFLDEEYEIDIEGELTDFFM
ncbi:MAG: hypothetical protein H0Z24_01855 [Thermosipho sp. (in: Bacteria)]|nr:hypothetical protein [Thermosipho sp. (in: thermotogales)]